MADAYAEIGAIQQAYKARQTIGKDMSMSVNGAPVCTYCMKDIATAAQNAQLNSLTINAVDKYGNPIAYVWQPGMTSIKVKK
nr:hypothetical protein [Chromobacterium sphagni]